MKVNTPENEISCVVGVGFGFDGSKSGVCQERFNPVFSLAQDKEICGVSGGVDSNKVEILAGSKSDEMSPSCSVSLDQKGSCCVVSGGIDESNDVSHSVTAPEDSPSQVTPESSPVKQISCVVCGSVDNLKFCSGCQSTHYCSKDCQLSHWSYHSVYCRAVSDLVSLEKLKRRGNQSVRQSQVDDGTRRKVLKLVGNKPKIKCWLNGIENEFLWDTGSMVTLVDRA